MDQVKNAFFIQAQKHFPDLTFQDWGLIDYSKALQKQLLLVDQTYSDQQPGYIIFCSHPPVVTLGRATKSGDVTSWNGAVIEVSRGGRATYHGPSQLMIYTIANINKTTPYRKEKEVVGHLRILENMIIDALSGLGIIAAGKSTLTETGVWVQNKKIASLGIAVKKWITYHGAAINVHHDPTAFQGILPCGFSSSIMTSIELCRG